MIKEDKFFKTNKEIKTAEFFVKLHNLPKTRELEVPCSSLPRRVDFLVKELYSTLSLFTKL